MKKVVSVLLSLFMIGSVLASCGSNNNSSNSSNADANNSSQESSPNQENNSQTGGQLNLFTWEGMFPQEVLDSFEEETGIKINYVNFDSDETMLTKLQVAKGGEYDIVFADDYIIESVISEGLAQPLDKSKLSNYSNINKIYQNQFFDPANEYTVPHGAGIQTIVYNPSAYNKEITSYADLWNSDLSDSVGIIGSFRVINGMALKVLGESYNTEDVEMIEKAGGKLKELAPNIRLIKDSDIQNDLLSGEISAGVLYTSQVTMAKLENPDLKVVFPSEGIGFGIIAGFIPSNAPNADAAYKFMNYLLDAKNAAACFEWLGYYCTNLEAEQYISDDLKELLILPENIDESNMEMIQNISQEAFDAHNKVWTEFKSACGQ